MTALEQLGTFVSQSSAPPPHRRKLLDLHVVDIVGAWVASIGIPEGVALLRWRDMMCDGAAPGTIPRIRLDLATHCALARLGEIDDIHLASTTTPGAIVVPGAVMIAAAFGRRDPAALAAAIAAGYEIMIRIGQAVDGANVLYRGIWPTYFTTPVAIAAVAARLLDLDPRQTAHALALALARSAPGVGRHNAATTSRWLAVGQAAETGLVAALAARAGFTSDLALLDGTFVSGIYDVKPDMAALTGALGDRFVIGEVSFKPWCAARQTMAATQAVAEIVESGVVADAIIRISVFVPPPHRRMIDHGVAIGDRASFLTSLPYRLALAVIAPEGAMDISQSPPQVAENVRTVMERVSVAADDASLMNFPAEWPARVEITTSSGRHERIVTHVPGDPARPFDAAAVQEKFLRFTSPAFGADAAGQLIRTARGLLSGQSSCAELLRLIEAASDGRRRAGKK
jgi:2-methylcitrate dehydratase PrpD